MESVQSHVAAPTDAASASGPARVAPMRPAVPQAISDLGISQDAIVDLLLKTMYVQGALTGQQLTNALCLPFPILDDELTTLQQRRLVEVRNAAGHGRLGYTFDITGGGRDRAREAFEANQYVGPVPVPLEHYRAWVERQTIRNVHVTRSRIEEGFRHMIIEPALFETLGPAINSAKSLFLYGHSGNGKTMIAEAIANMIGGELYLPYAVDIDGQVLIVHDPVYHRPVKETPAEQQGGGPSIWRQTDLEYDRRFARVRRPVVVVGGELTLEQLDLQYDSFTKVYQAPFQMKANGGILIIDDFGRQRVPPRDLLNRWIVPLEKRLDYLTLHTGAKFPVPFDTLMVISTNLDPADLVEEAFLRRIHYKVEVESPSREQYTAIFRRVCDAYGVPFRLDAIDFIYREMYEHRGIPARSCHPRDLIDHVCDEARFLEVDPALSEEMIRRACESYFISLQQQ